MTTAEELRSIADGKQEEKYKSLIESMTGQASIGNYCMSYNFRLTPEQEKELTDAGYKVREMFIGTWIVEWDKVESKVESIE